MDLFHMTSIGGTWLSMCGTGSGDALPTDPKHGPMQIRIYDCPFNTIGIAYVWQLPTTPASNKWILTVVYPNSSFLRAILIPDKQETSATQALFNNVFL